MIKISREVLVEATLDGIIKKVSPNCINVLGYERLDMIGRNINSFILGKTIIFEESKKLIIFKKGKNGDALYADIYKEIVRRKREVVVLISIIDVSRYKNFYDKAQGLIKTFDLAYDIIYRYDVREMRFTYISPSIYKNLGYSVQDNLQSPLLLFRLAHPDDFKEMEQRITGELDYSKPTIVRFRHKNGYYVWFEDYISPIYNDFGELIAIQGISRNINERKELESKLEYLSFHDGLTGLYNRAYFEKIKEKLNQEQDAKIGIILCDLDDLKITNDSMGHEEGDAVIRRAVTLMQSVVDESAIVSRIGGDEFAIIIVNESLEKVNNTVLNLRKVLETHNDTYPESSVNISMGYSYSITSIGYVKKVFEMADSNMYKEKMSKKRSYLNHEEL